MTTEPFDPATAVTWGPFVQAAYDQFVSDPGESNPSTIKNMPTGYRLMRTIQMSDSLGPTKSRVFYGFVAIGGDPVTAVVAVRGTATAAEWWEDLHWNLVPFTQVSDGGKVAQGFYDIYNTFGTSVPAEQGSSPASSTFAADIAQAIWQGLPPDPALPTVVCGHSLGGALATLLVADLAANTPLTPQAWTFASPRVGDANFAARYGALSGVSWRIYNQVDVVPYFPVDRSDSYQPVTAGYAINSLNYARWSLSCCHALNTYLHVLSPLTVPLNPRCQKPG
jgi:pimeloyl-ACP methyl ester carboxylesterase